jgi:hypothetical protein
VSCHIPWCTAPHTNPSTLYLHSGDAVPVGSSLAVRLLLTEWPGDQPDEGWVRLTYSSNGHVQQG